MAAAGSFPIEVVLKGLDLLSAPVNRAARSMERLNATSSKVHITGAQVANFGRTMVAAGAAATAAVGGVVRSALELDKAQVDLEMSFNRKLEGKWVDSIIKLTEKLGQELPGSAEDVTRMATAYRQAGGSAEQMARGGLKAAAWLAVVTRTPFDEMGRMFGEMSNALGVSGEDAKFLADQLQRVKFESGLSMQGVHEGLKHMGGPLKALGIQGKGDVDLLLAWMGSLKKQGLADEMIGSGMKTMFTRLAQAQTEIAGTDTQGAKVKSANAALARHGVSLKFFEKGKLLGLDNMIGQLDKLRALPEETQILVESALFGTRGMLPVMLTSIDKVNAQIVAHRTRAPIDELMKKLMGSPSGKVEIAQGTFIGTIKHLGKTLDESLGNVLDKVNGQLSRLDEFIQANPKIAAGALKIALGFGAIAMVGGGAAWSIAKISGALPTMAKGLRLVSSTVLANPWLLALVAGGILLAKHWDKVGPIMGRVGDSLGVVAGNVGDLIDNQVALFGFADKAAEKFGAWEKTAVSLAKAIEIISTGLEFVSGIMKVTGATTGGVGTGVTGAVRTIGASSGAAIDGFRGAKGSFWDKVKAANTAGGKAGAAASGAHVDEMLRPFEGIAARDPLGVAGGIRGAIDNFNRGRAAIAQAVGMTTTIQVTVPPGSPQGLAETIATAVDQRVKSQAKEYARILQGGAAIGNRGQYATQGVS